MIGRIFTSALLVTLAWLGALAPAQAAETARPPAPIIVFMTDYGTLDDSVAICKGVMLSLAPEARIVDLTHQVTAYSVADGARYLARASLYFPTNTIFVGVVDPGVGTVRRSIIAKSKRGHYFVVPDNGLLTLIEDRDGIEGTREITNPAWMLPGPHSATFHGRDIFSPAAGHLARGDNWTAAGPAVPKLVRLALSSASLDARGIDGHVVALDGPFGNLITDIKAARFRELGYRVADKVNIKVGEKAFEIPFVNTFGDVPEGQPLLYIDSSDLLSVAINQGNFAQVHAVMPPVALFVARRADKR
jgi:S-adenosylmethionine hydrolase